MSEDLGLGTDYFWIQRDLTDVNCKRYVATLLTQEVMRLLARGLHTVSTLYGSFEIPILLNTLTSGFNFSVLFLLCYSI